MKRRLTYLTLVALALEGCSGPDRPQSQPQAQPTHQMESAYIDSLEKEIARLRSVKADTVMQATVIAEQRPESSDVPLQAYKRLRNGRDRYLGEEVNWPVAVATIPEIYDWHMTARVLGRAGYLVELRSKGGGKLKDDLSIPKVYPGDKLLVTGRYMGLSRDGEPIIEVSSVVNKGI